MLDLSIPLHSQYIGQPETLTDAQGTWCSSINRKQVYDPVQLELLGLAGDRVAQPYHGGPGSAVCCHLLAHYRFWNEHYGMQLRPGQVGENWVLEVIEESQVCIGDIFRTGTALVQISGPRVPCANLARFIGRPDWVQLTLQELRTGFYLRVLEPGVVKAGDVLQLCSRPNPDASVEAVNRCYYHQLDPELAEKLTRMPELGAWWQRQFTAKLIDPNSGFV
jgi:MOSC domain-containing protein YiiM